MKEKVSGRREGMGEGRVEVYMERRKSVMAI